MSGSRGLHRRVRRAAARWPALALLALPAPVLAQESSPTPPSIAEFRDAFVTAVRAYDVDAWASRFAEDGVMMDPLGRMTVGREAFRELWSRGFSGRSGPNPLEVTVLETRISGHLATVRAAYGPRGGDPVGHYVWVLEREGSNAPWMLAWWIFTRSG